MANGEQVNGDSKTDRALTWVLPIVVSLLISGAAAVASYGALSQRVSELENRMTGEESWLQRISGDTNSNSKQIAVEDAQYGDIIRRLDRIEGEIQALDGDPLGRRGRQR